MRETTNTVFETSGGANTWVYSDLSLPIATAEVLIVGMRHGFALRA